MNRMRCSAVTLILLFGILQAEPVRNIADLRPQLDDLRELQDAVKELQTKVTELEESQAEVATLNGVQADVAALKEAQKQSIIIAFNVYRERADDNAGIIITYDYVDLNYGGAMNPTSGAFTVPLDGVYVFSFMFHERNGETDSVIKIRVDGETESVMHVYSTDDDWAPHGDTIILSLRKDQQVDVFLEQGGTWAAGEGSDAAAHTRFTGFLLYAL